MSDAALVLLGALGGILSGAAALWGARNSRRAGVAGDEREARRDEAVHRRDTIADRDGLIGLLTQRVEHLEARVTAAEDGNVAKALTIRAQGDHIDVLEDHIWRRLPPPPPRRPDGV